jgi:ABC-type uncharacterized transport system auxiliary subunit
MNGKVVLLCSLVTVSVLLSGCGPRAALNQRNFILEVSREGPKQKTGKDIILEVQSFGIDRTFDTKNLVYRRRPSEFETDFYNKFLITPEEMLTEKTRAWLSESGLFKWVLEPGVYTNATHTLHGNVIALYGDFSNESSPEAKMGIRFFVIKAPDKSIVFGKTYEAQSNIESRTAAGVIAAFDKCLGTILSDLEKDLEAELSSRPAQHTN